MFIGGALAILVPLLLSESGFIRFGVSPVQTLIFVFVLWATKTFMCSFGFNKANLALYIILAMHVLVSVVEVIFNTKFGLGSLVALRSGRIDWIGAVNLIVSLPMVCAWVWFALMVIKFGKLGGRVWRAIGFLYLFGICSAIALTVGMSLTGEVEFGTVYAVPVLLVLFLVVAFVYLAAFICHGIGLILGAGRMERMPNPADAF